MLRYSFFKELKSSEYGRKYLEIIHKGRHSKCSEAGELHHIYPRSFEEGKIDDKANLVRLTTYDHLLAHYYLAMCIPNQHTCWAFRMMCDLHLGELDPETKEGIEHLERCAQLRTLGRRKTPESLARQAEQTRGRVHVNKNGKERKIHPEELEIFIQNGWQKGRAGKVYNPSAGRVWIHKGTETTLVPLQELRLYLDQGWVKGRRREETTKGKIRMIKDGQVRYATRETFDQMVAQGYQKGAKQGRKKYIKDGKIKYLLPDQIQEHEQEGWVQNNQRFGIE